MENPSVELGDLVDQRDLDVQAGLEIGLDDLTAGRFDGELALADGEQARAGNQDDRHEAQHHVQKSGLHQRTPRARAGSSGGDT
jgi:hypothetical protein